MNCVEAELAGTPPVHSEFTPAEPRVLGHRRGHDVRQQLRPPVVVDPRDGHAGLVARALDPHDGPHEPATSPLSSHLTGFLAHDGAAARL